MDYNAGSRKPKHLISQPQNVQFIDVVLKVPRAKIKGQVVQIRVFETCGFDCWLFLRLKIAEIQENSQE